MSFSLDKAYYPVYTIGGGTEMSNLSIIIIISGLIVLGILLRLFVNLAEKVNFPMNIYYRIKFRKDRKANKKRMEFYGRD